ARPVRRESRRSIRLPPRQAGGAAVRARRSRPPARLAEALHASAPETDGRAAAAPGTLARSSAAAWRTDDPAAGPSRARPAASFMIAHVVLFRPRTDVSAADRRALALAFERALRAIPSVRRCQVGRRLLHGAGYEQRP